MGRFGVHVSPLGMAWRRRKHAGARGQYCLFFFFYSFLFVVGFSPQMPIEW